MGFQTSGQVTVVQTESGSVYRFRRDPAGRWWVRAANRASAYSSPIPENLEYQVLQPKPWPPELFSILVFFSAVHDRTSPRRIPGGGKVTSRVISIDLETAILQETGDE